MSADAGLVNNSPELWLDVLPQPSESGHKYHRGHCLVLGGGIANTGAARLAAMGALRSGAGLVTIASPRSAITTYAAHLTAIMLTAVSTGEDIALTIGNGKFSAAIAGPALGLDKSSREKVIALLETGLPLVLDADALTVFQHESDVFFRLIQERAAPVVLTPHGGEFGRLFAPTNGENRRTSVLQAAKQSGAIVLLKGAETLIAAPDGRLVSNTHASPNLATAGSGDVLAGIITGLIATGMPPFQAACAGAWIHGDAGMRFGPGLISEDLPHLLPEVLCDLYA